MFCSRPPVMSGEPRALTHGIVRPKFTSKTPLHFQRGGLVPPPSLSKSESSDTLESNGVSNGSRDFLKRHKKSDKSSSREGLEFSEAECDRELTKKSHFSIAV